MHHNIPPYANDNDDALRREIFLFNRDIARLAGVVSLKRFAEDFDV